MKYTTAKGGSSCEIKVKFAIDKPEWEEAVKGAYHKTKGKYKLHGFRPGKAPQKVIEKMYGEAVFYDEAFNIAFNNCYREFLEKEKEIDPIAQPEVSFDDMGEDGVKFTATIYVKPEIELGEYKGIEVKKDSVDILTDEVDAEIQKAREKVSRLVDVTDRAVIKGDHTVIDYSGSVDGVVFPGGTAEKQPLEIGSNSFIPGFEDGVVGMKIGEEKDISVKFPDEYHSEDLKGKDAVFKVKLHEIRAKELPELNDEFVQDTTSFNTVDEYREDIMLRLKEEKERKAENKLDNDLLEAVSATVKVDIPQPMIDQQLDYYLDEFAHRLSHQGMKMEDYFRYTNSTEEDFKKQRTDDAKKTVKMRLVLEQLIKEEELDVDQDETDKKIAEIAEKSKLTVEELKGKLSPQDLSYIKNEALMDKVMTFLRDHAVITGAAKKRKTAKKEKEQEETVAE